MTPPWTVYEVSAVWKGTERRKDLMVVKMYLVYGKEGTKESRSGLEDA